MSLILITTISLLGIFLGKKIFNSWVNHLTTYSIIMGGVIFFYELKWLPYQDLNSLTWFFLIGSSLSFFLGIITILSIRSLHNHSNENVINQSITSLPIFRDNGKALRNSIIFFSLVGFFVAIHRWIVLLGMFGDIPTILLNATVVYKLHVRGVMGKEFIPILPSFIYVGVFLSAIYTAYRGRFSFLSIFPLLCIVLKELTYFGRGELLFSVMQFLFTFFLFRNLMKKDTKSNFRFSKANSIVAITFLIVIIITAATFVKVMRAGAKENYKGVDKTLISMQSSLIITPSVYLYMSCHIGVLNKYLELEKEEAKLGENSFRIIYYLLSKFKITDEPTFFQKGYNIPMWTNTGTYIREIHADYGIIGVFLFPFLLGFFTTFLWFKFYEAKSLFVFTLLVYLFIIIGFSFLMIVTRLNQWFFSQILILCYLPILNRFSMNRYAK